MKQRTILALLLATLLLAVPLALASGPEGRGKAHDARTVAAEHRGNHTDDNETNDDNESSHANRSSGRNATRDAARDAWRENHTTLRDSYVTRLHAMKAAWRENATAIREACHNTTLDMSNATKDEREARAHCIHDGYKAWRGLHRVEMKELRADLAVLFAAWHPRKHHSD